MPEIPPLIAGPYRTPRCRVGRELADAIRGDVTVCGVSDAPIAWPVARTLPHSIPVPVMTPELARAVRTEAVEAIAHHWGVSRWTVRWRRALGVGRFTAGTIARYRELAPGKLSGPGKGADCGRKLAPAQATAIYRRAAAGESRSALAREFGVSRQLVSQIARGLRWASAPA